MFVKSCQGRAPDLISSSAAILNAADLPYRDSYYLIGFR